MEINSFFMSWDPLGTKMIVCAGAEIYSKPLVTLEAQEFFVRQANILLIDAQKLESKPLPGASTTEYMETFPAWSPDGKTIIFARAEEMGDEWHETRFNLYRLPFNDGNGGTPEPVPGAAENGVSSFFPRFSPDGKWLCFNQADWSSLVAPTADLFIMSTEPGAHPRKLECNVDYAMDSHHCWSSNSRWLLFATKRDDGVFATVWLSEIDENGRASPPVQIPTDQESMMCYNVPEFMKYAMPIDGADIVRETGYVD
jgi:Tol biopolymer transport system component